MPSRRVFKLFASAVPPVNVFLCSLTSQDCGMVSPSEKKNGADSFVIKHSFLGDSCVQAVV